MPKNPRSVICLLEGGRIVTGGHISSFCLKRELSRTFTVHAFYKKRSSRSRSEIYLFLGVLYQILVLKAP